MSEASGEFAKADYVALAAFRRALRRFMRYSEEGAKSLGITGQQYQVMLAIKGKPHREWASITELAEAMQVRHHAAVGLVDRCERANLVRRTPDPTDRRQVRVVLTERGEEILARLAQRNSRELRTLQNALQLPFLEDTEPERA